ncbi:MAG: 3'-5' exonuclease [Alysiella sp.]|uniref:3'-5' exonuclease n=1 Tax=Alysiella sp. TaxID=1872483 RepID=UPI0026DACB25|nr:3'-5' exonuclease [Alysiella sp.]MDO4434531.1 3'-5' exonuclease [Alysiella sp.]
MSDLQDLAAFFQQHYAVPVVILDLETTGGDVFGDRITEMAFLHFHQGQITAVQQLINPEREISPFITNLTGISNEMTDSAPTAAAFLPSVMHFLRGSLLIAHNSRFDYHFLLNECRRNGLMLGMPSLCSVQLSRKLYPEHHKHSLEAILQRHNIDGGSRHRAMSDVLALAHYLQIALKQRGADLWRQQARLLTQAWLPESVSGSLKASLVNIADAAGITIWRDHAGVVCDIKVHQYAYRETVAHLHHLKRLGRLPESVEFVAAVGVLHAAMLRAQSLHKWGLKIEQSSTGRHSVYFDTDPQDGCLKARIRPLKSGFHAEPPRGLFLHPKGAKRALNDWAREQSICPTQLGISETLPKGVPCPVSVVSTCVPACQTQDHLAHNHCVQTNWRSLRSADWGKMARVQITETDPISGQSITLLCQNGMIRLPESPIWYTDSHVLGVLKDKFKHAKQDIQMIE